MKIIKKILFSRIIVMVISIIAQLLFLLGMLLFFKDYSPLFYSFSIILSGAAVLWIVNSERNPAYKIAWIIPIMFMPILGGVFYLLFGGYPFNNRERRAIEKIELESHDFLKEDNILIETMGKEKASAGNQACYIQSSSFFPPYAENKTTYYSIGEDKFEAMMESLEKAESFIFMEYFIIAEGHMWDSILNILKRKVSQGVTVHLIYDDFGCMLKLPSNYKNILESYGIKCQVFNPLIPVLSSRFNTRDHRKITVIDGQIAFTGGVNIADEYINVIEKYGHWKDMGIKIEGSAVQSFTLMFLSLWNAISGDKLDFKSYMEPSKNLKYPQHNGFVQPFTDSPLDTEAVGQRVYFNMITKAEKYVYITTPYLIIDSEIITALCAAAKSGVDVRIITPHHGDKISAHESTRSYYKVLVDSGVKIYEYEKGFMHGKTIVSDDKFAVVGTINMDFRSLYLHFECGVWMYNTSTVKDVYKDFKNTLENSLQIRRSDLSKISSVRKLFRQVLRLFAPLM